MKIGKYFTLEEFTRSQRAEKEKITDQYKPPQEVIDNLKKLATLVADPIREQFGSFSPSSGYRCTALNKAVGGARSSEHLFGRAFDETFRKNGVNISAKVFFWLIENKEDVQWTKIIWEYGNSENPDWLHIEHVEGEKQQVLLKLGGSPYLNYFDTSFYTKHKKIGLIK